MSETTVPVSASYIDEPELAFCGGRHCDPKSGIISYGPYSLSQPSRHPLSASIGFIGSGETISTARAFLQECAQGVEGDSNNPSFPGCSGSAGFFVDLVFDAAWDAAITRNERDAVLKTKGPRERFEAGLKLVDEKLQWIASQDRPPDVVVLALPEDFLEKCSVADYMADGVPIHRDLRRAIKVVAMKRRVTTQLIREKTMRGGKLVDHKSKVAWNFFTALYFKLGAIPWSPIGLDSDTCYVGISFFRPQGTKNRMQASIAQAFNGRGDAIVLRGDDFPWSPNDRDKSPHLDAEKAKALIETVLTRYVAETRGHKPSRVVIHKTSRFLPDETEGFRAALQDVREYDLLAVNQTDQVRLLRVGQYPPLRGTRFSVGDIEYLYTTGFIPALDAYPHGHVPSPLVIADHKGGDTPVQKLLEELLILTKLNWNSAGFATRYPVTLGFAQLVGEIMREVPKDQDPLPNFKYYI